MENFIFLQCYLCDAENKMICESVTTSSDLLGLSRAAAMTIVLTVIDRLREKHQHVPLKTNSIVWSDGCSAQFRPQFDFKLLSIIDLSLNITWCYNERNRDKGPMDGIGGTLKSCIYRDVISGRSLIDTPKPFAKHANKGVKDIASLCFPAEDALIEPDDIEASPRITDTFQIHMIKRFFDEQKVPHLQFFKMATDRKTFFTQFYEEGA